MLAQYEAALSQAEATLAEDGLAFDRFLKESDEKVQQAMRKADAEMRLKQEKVRSNSSLLLLQSLILDVHSAMPRLAGGGISTEHRANA